MKLVSSFSCLAAALLSLSSITTTTAAHPSLTTSLSSSSSSSSSSYELESHHAYTFEQYVHDFHKEYSNDLTEFQKRKAIFLARLQEIKEHNTRERKGHHTYRKGINALTDRSEDELKALLGFKPSQPWHERREKSNNAANSVQQVSEAMASQQRRVLSEFPDELDWRELGAVTAPKNQGNCGSCWTFSGAEAIESALWVSTGRLHTLSEEMYVSCTPNDEHCGGTGGCSGGTQDLLYQYTMKHGFLLEDDCPYVSGVNGTEPMCCLRGNKVAGSIKGYVDVKSNSEEDHMIAIQSQPLAISLDASSFSTYSSGVMSFSDCGADLNHAVLLVGYGTSKATGQDYWLVRNSWGTRWGENGYIRLERSQICAMDTTPLDGTGCEGGPETLNVCGTCGMLYASSYPVGAYLY